MLMSYSPYINVKLVIIRRLQSVGVYRLPACICIYSNNSALNIYARGVEKVSVRLANSSGALKPESLGVQLRHRRVNSVPAFQCAQLSVLKSELSRYLVGVYGLYEIM